MGEIIFDKSRKNLKKVYNRIQSDKLARVINEEEVLFLAIGGYNRTFELLLAMGLYKDDIATFSNLNLTNTFIEETHNKKALYIRKINYVTNVNKTLSYTKKTLDLNVADTFEESMLIYKTAERMFGTGKNKHHWIKPSIVVLDDQSLNLQFDGHRFHYQNEIGFVQIRNRNANPYDIVKEIQDVEEADKMMFALYQDNGVDETEVLDALTRLHQAVSRNIDDEWYFKPTEFKKVVGSNQLANRLKEIKELSIRQLKNNKKLGKENACWVIVPETAFEFKGFDYQDEEEIFNMELEQEAMEEEQQAIQTEQLLNSILMKEMTINLKVGYQGNQMRSSDSETLHSFIRSVDKMEEDLEAISLLQGASTEQEYKHVKANYVAYFLDGNFKNDIRTNENYLGGKILLALDIDDGNLGRQEVERKLEAQGLFGLVYPTAKYYYDGSLRWRVIMMADEEMDVDSYRNTIKGVSKMLNIEIDSASEKIAQLMGMPFKYKDISIVTGTKVNVKQFNRDKEKVIDFNTTITTNKSIMDFNHPQAFKLKRVIEQGVPEGKRNNTYFEVIRYLRDTLNNPSFKNQHDEARELEEKVIQQMYADGLTEKEVEVICREI